MAVNTTMQYTEKMHVFNMCTPHGLSGLVVCETPENLYEILEAEGVDTTQCTLREVSKEMCVLFNTRSSIYTKKKPTSYSKVEPPTTLADDLYKQHTSGDGCDTTLMVEGNSIQCHKIVLSARSKYFQGLLTTPLTNNSSQSTFKISDFSYEEIKTVIKFIYTSELSLPISAGTEDETKAYLELLNRHLVLADFFIIPSLIQYIEQEILDTCQQNKRTMEHAPILLDIYNTAEERGLKNLQAIVVSFLPVHEDLRREALSESVKSAITPAFLLHHRTQFYFGLNDKLHRLLESGDVANKDLYNNVCELEESGADITAIFAAHTCARRMCIKSLTETTRKNIERVLVHFLVNGRYPLDSLDHLGQTMLHIAAVDRNAELVRMLIQKGASVDATDAKGLPIANAMLVAFDSEVAQLTAKWSYEDQKSYGDLEEDPTLTNGYRNMFEIFKMIPLRTNNWPPLARQCMESMGIELNEDFVTEAARVYVSNQPPSSLLTDGIHPLQSNGSFSRAFLTEIMHNRFLFFMTFMGKRQHQWAAIGMDWVKQQIRECLIQDMTDGWLERRPKLCSLCHVTRVMGSRDFPRPTWLQRTKIQTRSLYRDEYYALPW